MGEVVGTPSNFFFYGPFLNRVTGSITFRKDLPSRITILLIVSLTS